MAAGSREARGGRSRWRRAAARGGSPARGGVGVERLRARGVSGGEEDEEAAPVR